MATILACLNPKGGVGKTTTTVNLAGGLRDRGRRVLLVDLDDQYYCSRWAGVETGSDNLADALTGADELRPVSTVLGVDLLPGSGALSSVVAGLTSQRVLKRALRPLLAEYDYILLDCPGDLDFLTLAGLVASNAVILPMKTGPLEMESICETFDQVLDFLDAEEVEPRVKVLFGMYATNRKTHQQVVKLVVEALDEDDVFATQIPYRARLEECSAHHKVIFDHAPGDSSAQAFRELTDEVIAWLE